MVMARLQQLNKACEGLSLATRVGLHPCHFNTGVLQRASISYTSIHSSNALPICAGFLTTVRGLSNYSMTSMCSFHRCIVQFARKYSTAGLCFQPSNLHRFFNPQHEHDGYIQRNAVGCKILSSYLWNPHHFRTSASGVMYAAHRHYGIATEIKAKVRGIQKDIWPLTTKRIVRRKKTKDSAAKDKEVFDTVAYAIAEELDLESLLPDLKQHGLYTVLELPRDANEAFHAEAKYRVDNEPREIFFFREGSVVFWNMPEVERVAVLKFLKRHQQMPYDEMLIQQEYEKVEFTYTDTLTALVGDEIQLQKPGSLNPDSLDQVHSQPVHQLEKFAFSNALGLSVKLAIWEASLERYVDSIEHVLQDLKMGKKIRMSRGDVLRKTGELYTLRHLINLSSDLLDTPDFYWDREDLEALYSKTCNHLNIARRTKVMNEKLTYCCDLADLLTSHLNDKHHVRLEWMIILLIMVEVVFEVVHMIERHS